MTTVPLVWTVAAWATAATRPPRRSPTPSQRVGDRWTLLAIAALLSGPKRFNELSEELGGIAPNVLSARLKALTEQALVVSRPYSERPPRFVYELTRERPRARRRAAAARRLGRARRRATASRCATPSAAAALEARWWCPDCEQIVDDAADDGIVHV